MGNTNSFQPRRSSLTGMDELCNNKSDGHLEVDRQQQQHFIFQYIFESMFSSPIEEMLEKGGGSVLDIGCGAGTWLLEMAMKYKKTSFGGFDICKHFPSEIKPSNLQFSQVDVLKGLPVCNESVDYVRLSILYMSFTEEQYLRVLNEVLRVLRSGGYIEIFEPEPMVKNCGPLFQRLLEAFESMHTSNVNLQIASKVPELLESTNLVTQIQSDQRMVTIGTMGGKGGKLMMENVDYFFGDSAASAMARAMRISVKEYKNFWKQVHEECEKRGTTCAPLTRIWAQKV